MKAKLAPRLVSTIEFMPGKGTGRREGKMMKISYYKSTRNNHKFLEVREYSDGHRAAAQFMFWIDDHHVVKNWNGGRMGNRHLFRIPKGTLDMILTDYIPFSFGANEKVNEAVADRRSVTYFVNL